MKGNKNKNIYTSCHYIKIQELNEDLEGRVPAQIDCTVLGDLTQYVKAGIKVRATGFVALKEIFNTMSVHTPYTLTVDLNNLDPLLTNNLESMQKAAITEMDERKIWEMARDKVRLFETLLGSFAPHIFGHEFIKLGLMLSIVGSGRIKVNEVTIRDRIHTMLVGDPGVSKSQLLKFGEKVTMGSIYSSGRGVSGGGLTALTLKEKDGSFSIQPGALIFANNSVFWFDEADKTTDETKSHLHESMEDGTVSLIKGGQMATLQALTTVVFGANPRYSRYQEDMSIVENINMPDSLISRFDLIYIIKDTVNEALDRRISSHIAHILMKRTIPTYGSVVLEISDLIKYITYVKRQDLDPDITEGALKKFQDFYVDMRKKSTVDTLAITPRQFQAMLRLSRALARLLLDDKVTEYYADRIIDLMRYQLDNVMKDADGNYNVAQPQGKTASALKGSKLVIKVMKDLEADYDKDKIPKQKIRGILTSDYNMDTKEIDRLLDKMNADGLILHNGGQQFVRLG